MAAFSVNEIVEMAVQIERNGYAYYDEATKRKDLDAKSLELLTFLRDAELDHEKTFLGLRNELDFDELELSGDWEMIASYLNTIVAGRIFNDPESAIKRATEAKDVLEVIKNAITFEKDTLLYFHAINDGIKDERARQVLRRVIQEEVSHVLLLNDMMKKL
ncbi:MAG TPA: ferritin family protein [Candidatus Cloacimonadota bacterium]|nr:ferritin family protein [Candidatus Cloacimonadota bacterium]